MDPIIAALGSFMESGGDVLWYIAAGTFLMWCLFFERIWYIHTAHRHDVYSCLALWESRNERHSWHARMIRLRLLSEVNERLATNMSLIGSLIAILPLIGLLGTVTGMIQVFDAMTFQAGNARSMAAGVSAATIPTMAGMVATLSGLFMNTWLTAKVARESAFLEDNLMLDHQGGSL